MLLHRCLAAVFVGLLLLGPATPAAAEDAEFLVGFAQDDMSNDWRAAQVRAVERALAEHPDISFTCTDARGSTARNVLDIERLVAQGIDLLIVGPRNPKAMTPAIRQVHEGGIPVILLTRRITGPQDSGFTTFIGPADRQIAARAAGVLGEAMGGEGRILMLEGVPTATTAIARTKGFREALTDWPKLRIVASRAANYKRQDAIRAMEDLLRNDVAFDAIYAHSDSMAVGARLALRAHDRDPAAIPMVGIDYIPAARAAIREGTQTASFTYPTCGREAADIATRILHGESVPREITVESTLVTRDNVDDVEPIF